MKHFFSFLLCLTVFFATSAKQTLMLHSGEEIEVNNITIGSTKIQYKKASNPDGPTFSTNRSNVFFIVHEDGSKEIITPLDQTGVTTELATTQANVSKQSQNTIGGIASNYTAKIVSDQKAENEKIYFPKSTVFPRASIGFHGTFSGYEDSYDLEWGGLYWASDINVLIPSSYKSAWSLGLGAIGLRGDMKAMYLLNGNPRTDKIANFSGTYLTMPIQFWEKYSDYFIASWGFRPEVLINQKMNDQKVEEALSIFRMSCLLTIGFSFGHFDLTGDFIFNPFNAFRGESLDWSPTLAMSINAAYRF